MEILCIEPSSLVTHLSLSYPIRSCPRAWIGKAAGGDVNQCLTGYPREKSPRGESDPRCQAISLRILWAGGYCGCATAVGFF